MQEIMEVKDDIGTATTKIKESEPIWDDIFNQMGILDQYLKDNRWQGDPQQKCSQIQQAIRMYAEKIRPLFPDIQACLEKLENDKDSFIGVSENILHISSI